MRIDPTMAHKPLQIPPQQTQETRADREPDGDMDDMMRAASTAAPANQVQDTKIGNKVDILA